MAIQSENVILTLLTEIDKRSSQRARDYVDELEEPKKIRLEADGTQIRKETKSVGKSLGGVFAIAKGNILAQAFIGATQAIASTARESLQLAASFEQTKVAFETFLGSPEKATEVLAELNEFSLKTPFEPDQVFEAGKALLAFGEDSENLIPALTRIGDISAGTGKDFNELAVIYGKARVAGTLFAEDINQLTEAGVPIIQEFAKQLGVSESQVKKLASEGQISFANLEQAFKDLTGEGGKFFELTLKQSTTVGGLFSTFQGALNSVKRSFGEAFLPLGREILPLITDGLFKFVSVLQKASQPIARVFVGIFNASKKAIAPIIESLKVFRERLSAIGSTSEILQPLLNLLVRLQKVASVAYTAIIDGLGSLIESFSELSKSEGIVGKTIRFLADAFTKLPAFIGGFIRVLETFPTAVSDSFNKVRLNAEAFISDLGVILNPSNLLDAVQNGFSSLDFSVGDNLREQASDVKGFGESIVDAFNAGFQNIQDAEFELPELATPEVKESVNKEGEVVGDEFNKGVSTGLKKGLPPGSLAQLKKDLSSAKSELEKIANISNFEGKGIDLVLNQLDEIKKAQEDAELLEGIVDRLRSPFSLAPTANLSSQLGFGEVTTVIQQVRSQAEGLRGELEKVTDPLKRAELEEQLESVLDVLRKYDPELKEMQDFINGLNKGADDVNILGLTPEEAEKAKELAKDVANQLVASANQVLQASIDRKDKEIALQEERLRDINEIASRGNAEQLQLEEQRLDKLQSEREKAVQRQRQLSAIEITINNALALSNTITAITKGFKEGSLVGGLLIGAAIAATVASSIATLSGAFGNVPSFKVGTENVSGGVNDGQLIEVHGKERVLTAKQNKPLLRWGVKNDDVPYLVGLGLDKVNTPTVPSELRIKQGQGHDMELRKLLKKQTRQNQDILAALSKSNVSVNIDEDGIFVAANSALNRQQRRSRLKR